MILITEGQSFDVDVDDTLILWDRSNPAYKHLPVVTIPLPLIDDAVVHVHIKNVATVKKFAKLGYRVYVQSRSGIAWAEAVVKALNLSPYVYAIREKPLFYLDDMSADDWMKRIWRDPITGAGDS